MAIQILRAKVTRRDSHTLIVVPHRPAPRLLLEDRTGTLELLLDLLSEGRRTRCEVIRELTSHLDGACARTLDEAIDALDRLELLEAVEPDLRRDAAVPIAAAPVAAAA